MNQTVGNSPSITINGQKVRLKDIPPTMTLLEYLKQSARLGTKEGCGDGDCGACTVAIIGKGPDGKPHYQAINSCLVPIASVIDREIVTVEGIANGKLHPVQDAMVKTGGSQCGYCTPGFIMSMFAGYYDNKVDDLTVEGNLCRCTGYISIRKASELVTAAEAVDTFQEKLKESKTEISAVQYITNSHSFYRPHHLTEVIELLKQHPTATLVAGATDLGIEMSHHFKEFPILISLEAVEELKNITDNSEFVEIGAAVPLSHIEDNLHGVFPSIDEMLHWFAARQVRNRATLGGNIGTASPIGDLPPVLLSLDAKIELVGQNGDRTIDLVDFFKGYRQTDLQPTEVISKIKIPKNITAGASRRLSQSYKIGKRGTDDISIVAAAFTIDLDSEDKILHARLAYGGVAAIPIRAMAVESMLIGKSWNYATIQEAKTALKTAFTPLTDFRGTSAYRNLLVANLFEKFFVEIN